MYEPGYDNLAASREAARRLPKCENCGGVTHDNCSMCADCWYDGVRPMQLQPERIPYGVRRIYQAV